MSAPSIDWFTESVQECTTQRQYMRHRFLRTVQKQSPWLALASIFSILFGLPLIPLQATFALSLLQSLSSLLFILASLSVVYDTWRWSRMTRLLVSAVLLWFFLQVYALLSSHTSYSHVFSKGHFWGGC